MAVVCQVCACCPLWSISRPASILRVLRSQLACLFFTSLTLLLMSSVTSGKKLNLSEFKSSSNVKLDSHTGSSHIRGLYTLKKECHTYLNSNEGDYGIWGEKWLDFV